MPQSCDEIPQLPGTLRDLWQHWGVLKKVMDKASSDVPDVPHYTLDCGISHLKGNCYAVMSIKYEATVMTVYRWRLHNKLRVLKTASMKPNP